MTIKITFLGAGTKGVTTYTLTLLRAARNVRFLPCLSAVLTNRVSRAVVFYPLALMLGTSHKNLLIQS